MNKLELKNKVKTNLELSAKELNFKPKDMFINFNASDTLIREVWFQNVESFLVDVSNFADGVKDDSAFIDKFGTIHIPQMLAVPNTYRYVKGTTTLPLDDTTSAPADVLSYSGYQTYTDAYYADLVDRHELSFDILVEIQNNMAKALDIERMKTYLWEWAITDSNSIIATTGAAYTNQYGLATAKKLTDADFLNASLKLDRLNIPKQGRRVVLSASHANQLLDIVGSENYSYGLTDDAKMRGAVMMYRGFEVYISNYTPAFSAATTKIAYGGATSATSRESSIFYHPDFVRKASGNVIEFVGDGIDYLAHKRIRLAQFTGASPARIPVNNAVDGIVTIVDGA